jgi:DNA-binding MarR family transcriptional regulator
VTVTGPPDLRALTGYLLRRAAVKSRVVAEACITDDTGLRELAALSCLADHGAIPQRRLSELCGVSPTLIVRLVDGLEAKGLVSRERSATDRRLQVVQLTHDGSAAQVGQLGNLKAGEKELAGPLTVAEVKRLKRHLRVLLGGSAVLDVSPMAGHLGYLIAHAHRRLREDAARRLADLGLHPRDFGVLSMLRQDQPCSQAHLADRMGVSPPAILALLDSLETAGLVTRTRSEQDRRVQEISLTPAGRRTLAQAQETADTIQQEIVERLGPDADADLRSLLARLTG